MFGAVTLPAWSVPAETVVVHGGVFWLQGPILLSRKSQPGSSPLHRDGHDHVPIHAQQLHRSQNGPLPGQHRDNVAAQRVTESGAAVVGDVQQADASG